MIYCYYVLVLTVDGVPQIMTTYEVYDVEFYNDDGHRTIDCYGSITGEIANKDGQFPDITEEQARQNYLAHVSFSLSARPRLLLMLIRIKQITVYAFISYEPNGKHGGKRPAWTPARIWVCLFRLSLNHGPIY